MQQPALLIMVKNPIAGKTKTRLAKDVGHDKALTMYRMLMRYTRDQVVTLKETTRYLLYSDHVVEHDDWPADKFIKLVQVGAGLGERMQSAFDHAFARGHERVVIIGSDCPGITDQLLDEAYSALLHHEVVIGPATDGGYYLLGLRHAQPALFADMEWSTARVYEDTLARTRVQGLSVNALRVLSDVDHLADWEGYGWPIPD